MRGIEGILLVKRIFWHERGGEASDVFFLILNNSLAQLKTKVVHDTSSQKWVRNLLTFIKRDTDDRFHDFKLVVEVRGIPIMI